MEEFAYTRQMHFLFIYPALNAEKIIDELIGKTRKFY